jgi:23S rRNA-/tRNA-specific pseudouridylate synthase
VHLATSGTPIVGDALYGGIAGDRTLLHAAELRLAIEGDELVLRAPIPPELGTVGTAPWEDAT